MEQHNNKSPDEVVTPAQLQALLAALQQLTESLAPIKALAEKTLDKTPAALLDHHEISHTTPTAVGAPLAPPTTAEVPVSPIGDATDPKQYPSLQDITLSYPLSQQRLLKLRQAFFDWVLSPCVCRLYGCCTSIPYHEPNSYLQFNTFAKTPRSSTLVPIPRPSGMSQPDCKQFVGSFHAAMDPIVGLWPVLYKNFSRKSLYGRSRFVRPPGASYSPLQDGYLSQTNISGAIESGRRMETPAQGKIWSITPQLVTDKLTGVMEFDVLALLMHFFVRHQQVSHKSRCCGRHNKTYVSMEFVMAFIETFHQPSRLSAAFRWHIKPEVGPPTTHQEIVLQFHLRYLRPSQSRLPLTHLSEDEQGVVLHRLQAFITNGLKQIFSLEHGLSLCLMLTITPDFPYTILAVADQTPHRATEILVFPERATWEPNQILPCEGYPGLVGIAQFLASFSLQVERWDKGWTDTLEQIDEAFRRQITNSLDADQCESVMFDESFKLSKIYFTTIQVLNVASDWIEKSIGEWESLARRWVRETRVDEVSDQKGLGLVGEGWGHVTANFKAKADGHLDRIRQKREEVKALRDGLFNATSLREATKGMALNRAIYVFTIVTVIFTPISFMATFWALPLLNISSNGGSAGDTSSDTPRGSVASFIAVPLFTYVASVFFVCFLSPKTVREQRVEISESYYPPSFLRMMISWERLLFLWVILSNLPGRLKRACSSRIKRVGRGGVLGAGQNTAEPAVTV